VGRLPIPVIYVLTRSDHPADLSVTYDDAQGAELAIRHLLSVGRKRVAFVSGPPGHLASQLRRQGAERGLAAAGLSLATEDVLLGHWSEAWGRTAAGMLTRRPPGEWVDGIFCGSDQVARGVADGLREAGVEVPDDVSVVGFDNWQVMVEASRPPLTTVDPNLTRLGQESASLLLAAIDGGELGTGVVLRPCDLVLRESSVPR
jgi:LacI family transcriptional regulator